LDEGHKGKNEHPDLNNHVSHLTLTAAWRSSPPSTI
jgi:hypothetical protein